MLTYRKPNVGRAYALAKPQTSDEFNDSQLGPQWQWQANAVPDWGFPAPGLGVFRLLCVPVPDGFENFWDLPNLLLQKFPAPEFTATAKLAFTPVVMGADYAYLSIVANAAAFDVTQAECHHADRGGRESENGSRFTDLGKRFTAAQADGLALRLDCSLCLGNTGAKWARLISIGSGWNSLGDLG